MRSRDIMSTNVVAVSEETSIHDARKTMKAHKIRRLPVVKKDKTIGAREGLRGISGCGRW